MCGILGKNVINNPEPARRNARCCRGALRFPAELSFKFPGDKNKGVGREPGLRASAAGGGMSRMLRMQERLCSIPVPPQVKLPLFQPKRWPGWKPPRGIQRNSGAAGRGIVSPTNQAPFSPGQAAALQLRLLGSQARGLFFLSSFLKWCCLFWYTRANFKSVFVHQRPHGTASDICVVVSQGFGPISQPVPQKEKATHSCN